MGRKEGWKDRQREREGRESEIKRLWEWRKGREINKNRGRGREGEGLTGQGIDGQAKGGKAKCQNS